MYFSGTSPHMRESEELSRLAPEVSPRLVAQAPHLYVAVVVRLHVAEGRYPPVFSSEEKHKVVFAPPARPGTPREFEVSRRPPALSNLDSRRRASLLSRT